MHTELSVLERIEIMKKTISDDLMQSQIQPKSLGYRYTAMGHFATFTKLIAEELSRCIKDRYIARKVHIEKLINILEKVD